MLPGCVGIGVVEEVTELLIAHAREVARLTRLERSVSRRSPLARRAAGNQGQPVAQSR